MASKSSPPKPWEVRKTGAASSSVPVSSSVARSALEPTDPTAGLPVESSGRNPHIGGSTATNSPRVPPRPGLSSGMSSYGSSYSSPYASRQYGSSYGSSYGSGYGGYGSSYGGYGGGYGSSSYGSGYGGYGSSYGSGYGGYGGSYSRYGSGYGGYGGSSYGYGGGGYGNSYGRYGYGYQDRPPVGEGGALQSVLNGGYNQMNRFGMVVDSFSRFTRLLDANFDALHGSFASVLRLLDVFGEFFYVVRTFAVFRLIFGGLGKGWRIINFLVGRTNKRLQSGKEGIEVEDYKKFQSSQGRKSVPMVLVMMGIICVSLPLLLIKLWRAVSRMKLLEGFEDTPLDDAWKGDAPPSLVRARHGFAGESEMDLPFREGDLIRLLGKPFPDWWEGEMNGRRGLFPANFVEEVREEPKQM